MKALTERQRQILAYICQCIDDKGYPPTLREVGREFNIRSTNGVNDHIRALERKGYLTRDKRMSRTLVPTEQGREVVDVTIGGGGGKGSSAPSLFANHRDDTITIPVLDKIAARLPTSTSVAEGPENTLQLDRAMVERGSVPDFALLVREDSMIGDGILPGDLVFVRSQSEAEPGDIVAVLVGNEATVKRFYRDGNLIRLQPSNPTMRPILLSAEASNRTRILGKVVGVYRQL